MEHILAKEEFENFIKFSFESLKSNDFPASYSRRKIKNLFVNPNLQVTGRKKSKVKFGSRDVFIDCPREIYNLIYHFYDVCDKKSADLPKNARGKEESVKYKKFVEAIKSEKNSPKTEIGKLSEWILAIGIKWNIVFVPYYKKAILKYEVEGYYRNFWENKVLQFIRELQKGDDSLISIYEKIQATTVKYDRLVTKREDRLPYIINLILEKNDYLSIEKELEKLEYLFKKLKRYTKKRWGEHPFYLQLHPILMDIRTIIYQIRDGLKSGYCFTPFLLLRKLIVSCALFFFRDSYLQWYQKEGQSRMPLVIEECKSENYHRKLVETWINSFKRYDEWTKLSSFGSHIMVMNPLKRKGRSIKIPDINTFINTFKKYNIKNKGKDYYFATYIAEIKDKFLVQQLDVIRNYKMNIYSFAKLDKKISEKDEELYKEYRKLSGIVHEPICIDYPPFGSFLEYLAFLYHIRKILYSLQETFNCYKGLR